MNIHYLSAYLRPLFPVICMQEIKNRCKSTAILYFQNREQAIRNGNRPEIQLLSLGDRRIKQLSHGFSGTRMKHLYN